MNICSNVIYFCDAQLYFQHHYCSLQCHMIFRNHNNILIYCSINISDYYQCWKQSCCSIFLWKLWYIKFFRIHRWIVSSEEQHLFEIEIFCNINIFTVTIDYFNASLYIYMHKHKRFHHETLVLRDVSLVADGLTHLLWFVSHEAFKNVIIWSLAVF